MRQAALYLAASLCLILIVSLAWWTRDYLPRLPEEAIQTTTRYTVQKGDTVELIAEAFRVAPEELAQANPGGGPTLTVEPGQVLLVPEEDPGVAQAWGVHLAGLGAEFLGVLLSFWLAAMAAVLPRRIRSQILGISLVLGLVSYASAQAVAAKAPELTPQFVFAAIKDGFLWSAAFPMLARLLGIREPVAEAPEAPEAPTPGPGK